MKLIRKYIIAVIAGVLILIIVILRLTDWNRFTKVAGDLNTEISGQANIISIANNKDKLPVIDIRKAEVYSVGHPEGAVNIPMEKLLTVESRKIFKNNTNGMILYSDDFAMVTRAWSILGQMGYRNIFIAADSIETEEVLKYKFRPDTTVVRK